MTPPPLSPEPVDTSVGVGTPDSNLPSLIDSIPELGELEDVAVEPYNLVAEDIVDTKVHQEKDATNANALVQQQATTTEFQSR